MLGALPILVWQHAKKVCPHFLLSAYEWAWETRTYSPNKSLNTNKLYLLLTLKDQSTTWHNPKGRFALDSALQTKQDMHEINIPLSWSKSLVKFHPKPKDFCSNSIRTSTERNYTTIAFRWHRLCFLPRRTQQAGLKKCNFLAQPWFWRIFWCFSFTRNIDSSNQEVKRKLFYIDLHIQKLNTL